jgi:multiple sugar transport system substrate-binding protein
MRPSAPTIARGLVHRFDFKPFADNIIEVISSTAEQVVRSAGRIADFLSRGRSVVWIVFLLLLIGCTSDPAGENGRARIVFKHGKLFSTAEPIHQLIDAFERENPTIDVVDEELPSNTDEQHRFFVINLEAESSDFDVFSLDVIWVPEFSRAGWVRPLDHLLSEEQRADLFRGTLDAVTYDGRLHALPWFIGAGVLYYRSDLVETPPQSWPELAAIAQRTIELHPEMRGFIWQGKQYEGLLCDALEYIWSFGGRLLDGDRVTIDSDANRRALRFMRSLIERGISPETVLTMTEEPSRHAFQNGGAIFHRNWPYAWELLQAEGSNVRGKVAVAKLPGSFATLGGWHLGVNRYSKHPSEAEQFARFMISRSAQKHMAASGEFHPVYRSLYRDADLLASDPFIAELLPIFDDARPRPVSPYYMMISQVMQIEISAIIAGIRTPEEALASAQQQAEHIVDIVLPR